MRISTLKWAILIRFSVIFFIVISSEAIAAMTPGAFGRDEQLVRPMRLRDNVQLPGAQELIRQLKPDFGDVLEHTKLVNLLAGKEKGILSVADIVFKELDDYHQKQCRNIDRNSKPMGYKRRSDLVRLLLQNSPDAIELLSVMGIFKYDSHEQSEMKE